LVCYYGKIKKMGALKTDANQVSNTYNGVILFRVAPLFLLPLNLVIQCSLMLGMQFERSESCIPSIRE